MTTPRRIRGRDNLREAVEGKVVVVTGASSGIGEVTAMQFAARLITGGFSGAVIGTAWGYPWGGLGAGLLLGLLISGGKIRNRL